jgi:hypothetical protein
VQDEVGVAGGKSALMVNDGSKKALLMPLRIAK